MASPQVADGETAHNMKGKYENVEKTIADIRQEMVLQPGFWRCYQLLKVRMYVYEIFIRKVSDLD